VKKFLSFILLAVFSLATAAQAATEPAAAPAVPPAGEELAVTEMTGTVESIDHEKRIIAVKGPEGNILITKVDDDVPNLKKVKKGDKVNITYYQSLAWEMIKSKTIPEPAKKVTTTTLVGTDKKFPFKIETEKVDLFAKITELDLANNTVTLLGPDGNSVTITAKDPANLKKVKKGDIVEIHYTEAVAAAVSKK
jgi:Cu/Ag efflux protein CusF